MLLLPFFYSQYLMFPFQTPKELYFELIIILFLVLYLFNQIFSGAFKITINSLDLSVILNLSLIASISLFIFNSYRTKDGLWLLALLTIFYVLVKGVANINKNNVIKFCKRIYLVIVISCSLEGLFAISQFIYDLYLKNILMANPVLPTKLVVFGTFGNPNLLGIFLAACFPFCLYLYSQNKNQRRQKIIYTAIIGIVLIAIIFTQSRGAWAALLFSIITYFNQNIISFFKALKNKKNVIASISIIIVSFCILSYGLYKVNENSALGRVFVWKVTLQMIHDNPIIGVGYNNFASKYLDSQEKYLANSSEEEKYFADDLSQSHNEYLKVFAETGLIGIAAFVFIVYMFFAAGRKILRVKNPEINSIVIASISSSAAILVHMLIDCPFRMLPLQVLFFVNIGVVSLLFDEVNSDLFRDSIKKIMVKFDINKLAKVFLFCCSIGLLFYYMQNLYKKFSGYLYWKEGFEYVIKDDYKEAIKSYHQAAGLIPDNGELLFNIGAAYLNNEQPELAMGYLENAAIDFKNKNLYLSLSFAYQDLSMYDKAEAALLELSRKFPNLLIPHLLLSRLYLDKGELNNADRLADKVINMKAKFDDNYARNVKRNAVLIKEEIKEKTRNVTIKISKE